MCQVNGGGPYSAPWGSETPEPIHLKFGVFDYVHRPTRHANTVAAVNGGGHRGEVVPSRAFSFFIFLVHSTHPQLTPRSVILAQCTQKCVSVVGELLWVGLPRGSNLPPLPL